MLVAGYIIGEGLVARFWQGDTLSVTVAKLRTRDAGSDATNTDGGIPVTGSKCGKEFFPFTNLIFFLLGLAPP